MPAPNLADPKRHSYDYAVLRIVPRVERHEFLNVGVILFCRTQRFLAAEVELDVERLQALAPNLSSEKIEQIERHLNFVPRICAGEGPIGALEQAERFHWLVAPHSTLVQMSPVHCGLCIDPARALENLMKQMVKVAGVDISR